jgi:hypothetical protein
MGYKGLVTLGSVGVGAGLYYLFDSDSGKKRRAVVRKKAEHLWHNSERAFEKMSPVVQKQAADLWHNSERAIGKISHDVSVRAQDLAAKLTAAKDNVVSANGANGDALRDRVWLEMRRTLSDPDEIRVTAEKGKVKLVGSVPKNEVSQLLARVSSLPGITELENRLSVRKPAYGRWWKPLLLTAAGSVLAVYGRNAVAHRPI